MPSSGLSLYASEDSSGIQIQSPQKTLHFSRDELLKKAEATSLTVNYDPTYKNKTMVYKIVKVTKLFQDLDISSDAIIQFKCLDGFSAPLSTDRLLNTSEKASIAYIAIEDPSEKWPTVKNTPQTAGPFYLVWKNPELSHIGSDEWPYQLAGFEIKDSLKKTFPRIFPSEKIPTADGVYKGFQVFTKNCFACHTMNLSGESQLGPDLNAPHNPTEYLSKKYFKLLVRNPQNLRHWPQSKMASFSTEQISDQELEDLFKYLKHMSRHHY